jgi:hypothetical protein
MDIDFRNWRKSTYSDADGNCVEVGESADGQTIGIRDTKSRGGGTLTYSRAAWTTFLHHVRQGEFG